MVEPPEVPEAGRSRSQLPMTVGTGLRYILRRNLWPGMGRQQEQVASFSTDTLLFCAIYVYLSDIQELPLK